MTILNGSEALELLEENVDKGLKKLKSHEIRVLRQIYQLLSENGCDICHLDGFFVGYCIPQIGKEFDLLRFGENYILNIELKSELKKSTSENQKKIFEQMQKNYYYLRFLNRPVLIFTFVEHDGFYFYEDKTDTIRKVDVSVVVNSLISQLVQVYVDPDMLFVPSNYLVSPFNSPGAFLSEKYFLTKGQQKVKDEIFAELSDYPQKFFCISANAGTGKTLLLYDVAKQYRSESKNPMIIHCGILNAGHEQLRMVYGWDIRSIKHIPISKDELDFQNVDMVLVDESQRIHINQLEAIIQKAEECSLPVIFSYDVKQFLKDGENTDINEYLRRVHPNIVVSPKTLTNKIRTNKEMASFIKNLADIGSSKDHLNYACVSVEYMNDFDELMRYVEHLKLDEWTVISYTISSLEPDPYERMSRVSDVNAHKVIGQEFSKVILVMDGNFFYDGNKLKARSSYYSARGMLYQIVTRAVEELKIIVFNNPGLYYQLLKIKAMGSEFDE